MKVHFEHHGRVVLVVELEDLTPKERWVVGRMIVEHSIPRAGSLECNAE